MLPPPGHGHRWVCQSPGRTLSLALIKRDMEGLWVVPALREPPIKCASHSKWRKSLRQRVQLPPAQPVPGGYTASVHLDTALDALPPTERALAARGVPWYDVPDVCVGWDHGSARGTLV